VQIVRFATWIGELLWPGVSLSWIHSEFQKNISKEINFLYEADNAEKIKRLFKDEERVVIPKVINLYNLVEILNIFFKFKSLII
jgi:predicted unusual protein kinase regulating ubiquinone biosynthesis (AarF/ABC1/UbiB family)